MGQSSFEERRNSGDSSLNRPPRTSFDRSPQKMNASGSASTKESASKASKAQDLISKLHREEKIRDAASAMLADLNYGQGQQHKHPANVIKQLNNLNSLKADSQHKKKVKAQFEAAEREVQLINDQLRDLGFDEDDEISSGDEEGPTGGTSMLFAEDYNFTEDENKTAYMAPLAGLMTSSAASSTVDLSTLGQAARDTDHTETTTASPQHSAISPETAAKNTIALIEALDPRSPDTQLAVDKICELIYTAPAVSAEMRVQAPWEIASNSVRPFLLDKDPHILGLGLRILRLLLVDISAFRHFNSSLHLNLLIVQILSKDDRDKNHQLRLHATQLVRSIINVPGGAAELHQGAYRALVAVAEQTSDDLRHICVETLAELMVIEPERVFKAGAVKVMLNAMNEPAEPDRDRHPKDESNAFALAIAMAFSDAADCPLIRRKYLRDGRDLSALLTHFTDAPLYGFIKPSKQRLQASAVVMHALLRSWVGLCCFDLKLFVQCLTVPLQDIQDTLLTVLDNVLWLPETGSTEDPSRHYEVSAKNAEFLSHQFTAILLNKLQRCGLQEKLVMLQTEGANEQVRKKALYIGSKIFLLSAKLVPQYAVVNRSMVIPDHLTTKLAKASPYSLPTASLALFGSEAELQQLTVMESKPNLQTFIRFGLSMDDASFKRLINSTHVLDTKIFRQWNWDALMELVQGPLRSPKRLDELTRSSKFMKRLLSFYRPFKYRFCNLAITRDHLQYVEVGKELMQSLLETTEGARYLSQNKLFRQIAECLAQLDPLSGIMSNEPLFSVRRFRSTLCGAYSELIGVLSRSVVGQQILAQIRIFNMFYRVCDINREDVVRSVICALDYKMEGHPRLILAKALTASSRSTRLYATEFVGSQLAIEESNLWAVDLLIEQLNDVDSSVAKAAAVGLHNMCVAKEHVLDYVISMKPFLGYLNEATEPLRILFMSRPRGFELLQSELESENIDKWAPEFNVAYVEKIETYLESVNHSNMAMPAAKLADDTATRLNPEPFKFPTYSRPSRKQTQGGKLAPPSHIYGELALTDQGCRFLISKGCIKELGAIIKDGADPLKTFWTPEEMRRLKGALWAAGHVASRQKGGVLLDLELAENICSICKNADVFSLRGTAFYALGLFAHSLSGAELLHQCGWDVVYDVYNRPLGVALPPDSYYRKVDSMLEIRKDRMSRMVFPPKVQTELKQQGSNSASQTLAKEDSTPKLALKTTASANSRAAAEWEFTAHAAPIPYNQSKKPATPISPLSYSGKPGETAKRPSVSGQTHLPPHLDTSKRLRTPSVGETDSLPVKQQQQQQQQHPSLASPLLAPSISSLSLNNPSESHSSPKFDFEVSLDESSRRSSCLDLVDEKKSSIVEAVLQAVSQLGSYVLAPTASRALVTLRTSHPELFQNGDVLQEVSQVLASGHYKQITRRFVFELFDMQQCLSRLYRRSRTIMV